MALIWHWPGLMALIWHLPGLQATFPSTDIYLAWWHWSDIYLAWWHWLDSYLAWWHWSDIDLAWWHWFDIYLAWRQQYKLPFLPLTSTWPDGTDLTSPCKLPFHAHLPGLQAVLCAASPCPGRRCSPWNVRRAGGSCWCSGLWSSPAWHPSCDTPRTPSSGLGCEPLPRSSGRRYTSRTLRTTTAHSSGGPTCSRPCSTVCKHRGFQRNAYVSRPFWWNLSLTAGQSTRHYWMQTTIWRESYIVCLPCSSGGEREKERKKETERQTDWETDRKRRRECVCDRETERERVRGTERQRKRVCVTEGERGWKGETQRARDRKRLRDRDREQAKRQRDRWARKPHFQICKTLGIFLNFYNYWTTEMFYFNFFVTKPHFVKSKKTELECDVRG